MCEAKTYTKTVKAIKREKNESAKEFYDRAREIFPGCPIEHRTYGFGERVQLKDDESKISISIAPRDFLIEETLSRKTKRYSTKHSPIFKEEYKEKNK